MLNMTNESSILLQEPPIPTWVIFTPHRFSLLINSLINFLDRVDIEVSLRLGLKFYRSNSIILFCSPLHVHFSTCC